jgi:hypothetical protein
MMDPIINGIGLFRLQEIQAINKALDDSGITAPRLPLRTLGRVLIAIGQRLATPAEDARIHASEMAGEQC